MKLFDRMMNRPGGASSAPMQALSAPIFQLQHLGSRRRYENECAIRALTSPVFLGEGTVLCRTLGRYKTYVDARDSGLSAHVMLDGYWEMWVTEAMTGFVRPGMRAVDCGANIGYFTLLLADLVGPEGHVTAIEPNPRMVALLRRSLLTNGFAARVTLCDRPAYDESGVPMTLHVPEDHPQNAYLVVPRAVPAEGVPAAPPPKFTRDGRPKPRRAPKPSRAERAAAGGPGVMTTVSLDDLVGDAAVDFVKIDVEGAEERVWAGMSRILARRAPLSVFLEFNAWRYEEPKAFLDAVLGHGFAMASIDPERGVVPVGPGEVLARESREDWMLVLAR